MELLLRWKEHRKVTRAHLKIPALGKYVSLPRLPKSHLKKFGKETVAIHEDDANNRTFVNTVEERMKSWKKFDDVGWIKHPAKICSQKENIAEKMKSWETFEAVESHAPKFNDHKHKEWVTTRMNLWKKFDPVDGIKPATKVIDHQSTNKDSGTLLRQKSKCNQIVVEIKETTFWAGVSLGRSPALCIIVQGPPRAVLTPFLFLQNVTLEFKNHRYKIVPANNWNPSCLLQLLTRSADKQRSLSKLYIGFHQQCVPSSLIKRCYTICHSSERSVDSTSCVNDEGHGFWRHHFLELSRKLLVTVEIYERLSISNRPNLDKMMTTPALCGYFLPKFSIELLQTFAFVFATTLQIEMGAKLYGHKRRLAQIILTLEQTTNGGVKFNRFLQRHSVIEDSGTLLRQKSKCNQIVVEITETRFWAGVSLGRSPALCIIVQGPPRALLTPFLFLQHVTLEFKNRRYKIVPANNWNPSCLLQLLTRSADKQRSLSKLYVGFDQQCVPLYYTICHSSERSVDSTGCDNDEGHGFSRHHFLELSRKLLVTVEIYERLSISNRPNVGKMMTTPALCGYFLPKFSIELLQTLAFVFATTLQIEMGAKLYGHKRRLAQIILTLEQTTNGGVKFNRFLERHSVIEVTTRMNSRENFDPAGGIKQETKIIDLKQTDKASAKSEMIKRSKPRRKGFISQMWQGLEKIWTRRRTSE